jgi:hypothetical protein
MTDLIDCYNIDYEGELSNCCGANIIHNTDICSACGEHCEPMEEEEKENRRAD